MYFIPASLSSDIRPACPGMGGRFAPDCVAGFTGIHRVVRNVSLKGINSNGLLR